MKVLIWIACMFCASIIWVFLGYAGIGGALPAVVIYLLMFAAARFLCEKYDDRRSKKVATDNNGCTNPCHSVSSGDLHSPPDGGVLQSAMTSEKFAQSSTACKKMHETSVMIETASPHLATYCRKCGKKLIEDSNFCSFCGTAVAKE